jgi:hypothetical protein
MAQGLTDDLLLVAFTVWLSGLWVCRRDLPFLVALIVTSIRVFIPVVNFAWFYYGTWTFSDGLTYVFRGILFANTSTDDVEKMPYELLLPAVEAALKLRKCYRLELTYS